MDVIEVRKMRRKQFIVVNTFFVIGFLLYIVALTANTISDHHIFFILGVITLSQGIIGYIKKDSTKSIIPIITQVARYEKDKMGEEWEKQRKLGYTFTIVTAVVMFFLYFVLRNEPDISIAQNIPFLLGAVIILIAFINIGMIIQNRKVDRAVSDSSFKGYGLKTILFATVVGLIGGFILVGFIILYIVAII